MKQYLIPALTALSLGCGAANVEVRNGKDSGLERELQQKIVDTKECDRVYWTSIPLENKNTNLLVCDEKVDGQYQLKKGINLDTICDVRLKENSRWYTSPIDWMWGDDVVVKTKERNVYSLRFWDKPAKQVYEVLSKYIHQNVSNEEVLKCQK